MYICIDHSGGGSINSSVNSCVSTGGSQLLGVRRLYLRERTTYEFTEELTSVVCYDTGVTLLGWTQGRE